MGAGGLAWKNIPGSYRYNYFLPVVLIKMRRKKRKTKIKTEEDFLLLLSPPSRLFLKPAV